MRSTALAETNVEHLSEKLQRLRDCLRPASLALEPPPQPIETVWSAQDRLLRISANVEEHLGWEPRFLHRVTPGHWLYRPGDREPLYALFFRCLMGCEVRDAEYRFLHADGTGYVWLCEDMSPGRRGADGRVREVRLRTYNVTAIRAREVDFLIECLKLFHPRHDARALEELGVPALLSNLFPGLGREGGGRVVPFRLPARDPAGSPGMEPAHSGDFIRSPRRRP